MLWDSKTGKTVYNAIVWQDRRTEDYCKKLRKQNKDTSIFNKTGLLIDPYFSGTKIVHYKGESVKTAPYDSRQAFYDSMDIFVDKHYSSTLGLVTRFFISFGIRLNKLLASINEKKSLFLSLLMDLIIVSGSFSLAVYSRFSNFNPIFDSYGLVPIVYVVLWISVYSYLQLYSRYILSYSRALMGTLIGFLLAVLFTYFFKQFAYSRLVIINASSLIALLLPGWRIFTHYFLRNSTLI